MIWGYPHFRKPPCVYAYYIYIYMPLISPPFFSIPKQKSLKMACWSAGATKMGYYEKFLAMPW